MKVREERREMKVRGRAIERWSLRVMLFCDYGSLEVERWRFCYVVGLHHFLPSAAAFLFFKLGLDFEWEKLELPYILRLRLDKLDFGYGLLQNWVWCTFKI
jgi:hypothetical protein